MSKEQSNVVTFPKEKLLTISNIQTQDEYVAMIEEYKTNFADEVADILSAQVFGELARSGADFTSNIDELFPSMMLVLESIRALHLRASGVHHPLQDFADEAIGDSPESDEEADEEADVSPTLTANTAVAVSGNTAVQCDGDR